jgi:ribonuclease HII
MTTLAELRERYVDRARPLPASLEAELRGDPRPGAKAILDAVAKRRHARRAEGQRLRKMLRFEQALWGAGTMHVAGIDEAGMSPLAGPVHAAAVIFLPGSRLADVDDSKKLDAKERERLALEIKATACAWAVGVATVEEIDTLNIYWAGLLAMQRAVEGLKVVPQHLLIDARRLKDLTIPQERIVKGDA